MNCFVVWLTYERQLALLPAGTIVRYSYHRKSSTRLHTIVYYLSHPEKQNVSFMDWHFIQLVGKAMGTKATSPYTNHFMDRYEEYVWQNLCLDNHLSEKIYIQQFLIFIDTTN